MDLKVDLSGKVVIVTGGSKGIGKGIATVFAKQGAHVVIAARGLEHATKLASELQMQGYSASGAAVDVESYESVENMAQEVAGKYGAIDILCSNAGIFPSVKLEDMSTAMGSCVKCQCKRNDVCCESMCSLFKEGGLRKSYHYFLHYRSGDRICRVDTLCSK